MSKTLVIGTVVVVVSIFALGGFLLWQQAGLGPSSPTPVVQTPPPAPSPQPQNEVVDAMSEASLELVVEEWNRAILELDFETLYIMMDVPFLEEFRNSAEEQFSKEGRIVAIETLTKPKIETNSLGIFFSVDQRGTIEKGNTRTTQDFTQIFEFFEEEGKWFFSSEQPLDKN